MRGICKTCIEFGQRVAWLGHTCSLLHSHSHFSFNMITTHGNGLVCAIKCFRWSGGKAVWLWYTLTMTQHCERERHNNDGCLQVTDTTRLHCTTHHRHMDEGLCLLTCKDIGLSLSLCLPPKKMDSFSNPCLLKTSAVLACTLGDLPL